MKINLFEPYSDQQEINAVTQVIKSGWWKEGNICEELELEFCKFTGAKYAVSVNSATAGLDLLFKVYDIKHCDVIMPALTFLATGLAALYNNCKIIFADIDPKTLTLDPEDVKRKITKKTKAIILQHHSGNPCDLDAFDEFKKQGIMILEDAAHGMGSYYHNEHVGVRNPAAFSFNVIKNVAAGEGGMITVSDSIIAQRLKTLRWYGIDMDAWIAEKKEYKWDYVVKEIGYKYHFNDILASIALIQLKRLKHTNSIRSLIAAIYKRNLFNLPIILPSIRQDCISSWHQYVIRVKKEERNSLLDWLIASDIGVGMHFKPLNTYPIFPHAKLPVTDEEWQRMITLPMHPNLKSEQVEFVCQKIAKFYGQV